ncbi:hypothetical protein Tco_0452654 [Tanacetum coccineum]
MTSTSTHQQSLENVGSETRPHMLEKGNELDSSCYIPNYIYDFVDACEYAKRYVGQKSQSTDPGFELSKLKRGPRDTKFLNSLQPEWTKYVTNVRLAKNLANVTYDALFDYLQHSSSSQSLAAYYVTHPPSVVDYDDDYQGDAICDDQEDSLTTTMMLLSHAITQRYSTPTNNRLRTYSNTRNQAIVQADRVDIQSKIVGNDGRYARRSSGTQGEPADNGNVQKETRNGNYFLEQMLLAEKDEAGIILTNEQHDFLLVDAFEIEELEDLRANICMMARIQQAYSDSEDGPSYDFAFISEVQNPTMSFMNPLYSQSDHEQTYHEQHEIVKTTIGNDQINSDIIFDDPNVEVNNGKVEHDKITHDQQDNAMELLARNTYKEAEKQLTLAKKVNQQ